MINKLLEYLMMKWLQDGWKYIVLLTVILILAHLFYPAIQAWLYNIHTTLYIYSWEVILLAAIGVVTCLGLVGMILQVLFVSPKLGKVSFNKRGE